MTTTTDAHPGVTVTARADGTVASGPPDADAVAAAIVAGVTRAIHEQYAGAGAAWAAELCAALTRAGWAWDAGNRLSGVASYERVMVAPDAGRAVRVLAQRLFGAFAVVEPAPVSDAIRARVRHRIERRQGPVTGVTIEGPQYVCRMGRAFGGGWLTPEPSQALEWKTAAGARRWLAERPELAADPSLSVAVFIR